MAFRSRRSLRAGASTFWVEQGVGRRAIGLLIAATIGFATASEARAQPSRPAPFIENFSSNSAGWTLDTEWQIGSATASSGQNSGNPDPATDFTPTADNGVAGMVIGGNISIALHGLRYLTSPPIDTTTLAGPVQLSFRRWLNQDYTPYMKSQVEVWNGTAWVVLWASGASPAIADNAWTLQTFDVTMQSNSALRVRFGLEVGNAGAFTVSGWNIDDVQIGKFVAPFNEDFSDNSAGWTLDTEWQIGSATASSGQQQGNPDPATDFTPTADNGVAGMVIGGNISTAVHGFRYLTSPPIDTTTIAGPLRLNFRRWLNTDFPPYMESRVEVWNGSAWVAVWQQPNDNTFIFDNSWALGSYDITMHSNSALRVRFGLRVVTAGAYTVSGWNIDDVQIGKFVAPFNEDFSDNSAGWTLDTEWQIGSATASSGQAGGSPDPATDYTPTADNGIAGMAIGGNISTAIHGFRYLTSPPIDTTTISGPLRLNFRRWLNTDYLPFMESRVEVWNGSAWVAVWQQPNDNMFIFDNSWVLQSFDITMHSNFALRVRFGLQVGSNGAILASGWNVDDVQIIGTPTVVMPASSLITDTAATLYADVAADGGSSITERGFVYSDNAANPNPLIDGASVTKVVVAGTTGAFSAPIASLLPLTTYAFKGYATNAGGTSYTTNATFTTLLPSVSISDVLVAEGNSGATNAVFTLTLSSPSPDTITVSATTSNLSANAGSDYVATGPTVVTFPPSSITQTFSVPVNGDTTIESDETFQVTLSSPTNALIGDGIAVATITNDDSAPPSRVFVATSGSDANVCSNQTTPCRNLTAAISQLAIDGEVIVLSPGEYDTAPILIGKGLKITSPSGTVAFIRQPITVNAPGGRVTLRGLTLKGDPMLSGVTLVAADSVSIEETTFDSWNYGIEISNAGASRISIASSVFQSNQAGVQDLGVASNRVTIVGSRFEGNNRGLAVNGGTFAVSQSLFASNNEGVSVDVGPVEINRSEFWGNTTALAAPFGGVARVGRSHIFGNATGISSPMGSVISFGSNVIRGNGTDISGMISTIPEQ